MIRIIINVAKILLKRKSFLITTFFLPIALIFAFTGIEDGNSSIKLAVINEDSGAFGREIEEKLSKLDGVSKVEVKSEDYVQDLVYHKYEMVIKIDKLFTDNIIKGEKGEISYQSISNNDTEAVIKGFLESEVAALAKISNNINVEDSGIDKVIKTYREARPEYEVLNSRDIKPSILSSLGIIFYLLFITASGSCRFILEDEKEGTKGRVLMGNISERQYYFSQCIVFFLFTAVPSIEYYAVCKILDYEFGFNNTIILLFLALLMSLLAITYSIMIASIVKNKSVFTIINSALTVPVFMLSGAFWDYGMMSKGLQKIGDALPPRWIFMAIEKLQAGNGFVSILPIIGGILVLSILFLLLSAFFTQNKIVLVKENG